MEYTVKIIRGLVDRNELPLRSELRNSDDLVKVSW